MSLISITSAIDVAYFYFCSEFYLHLRNYTCDCLSCIDTMFGVISFGSYMPLWLVVTSLFSVDIPLGCRNIKVGGGYVQMAHNFTYLHLVLLVVFSW